MTLKKVYVDRQPKVGDWVEVISNPFRTWDTEIGYEYEIVRLFARGIAVKGERLPPFKDTITVGDGDYKIFEYHEVPEPKETHVKHYKFLGIPFGTRTTYVY